MRLPEAAVVAAERAVEVAFLDVQVMAQDSAAVAKIGAEMKQVVVSAPDHLDPERHDLHETASAGGRDCVFLEAAFYLD